ncbi:hypothetical protein GCM10009611_10190 [Arthrobacter roseus]
MRLEDVRTEDQDYANPPHLSKSSGGQRVEKLDLWKQMMEMMDGAVAKTNLQFLRMLQ